MVDQVPPAPSSDDPDRWPYTVGTLNLLKQQIAQIQPGALIGTQPPNPPASPSVVADLVERLAAPIPDDLREWLTHGDGWPNIWFGMTMLPSAGVVRATDAQSGCALDADPARFLLVASADGGENCVYVALDDGAGPGVLWVTPDSHEGFGSLYDFFSLLVQLHRDELDDLQHR